MSVRPTKLDDIIGQDKIKEKCKILIESSIIREAPLPHMLFSGPAGTGKTTFARVMAVERGVHIKIANAGSINNIESILKTISTLNHKEIFFIDEIHRLPNKVNEWLYTVMEDFRYEVTGKDGLIRSIAVAPFTMLGATTNLGHLEDALRDRFKHTNEFEPYSLKELKQIVARVAKIYKFILGDKTTTAIAQTCRGNPRKIVSRTEWIRDYMVSKKLTAMSASDAWKIMQLQGVDKNGLEKIDHRYLNVLKEGDTTSLNSLSAKLSTDIETIKNTIEPYLLQIGLIDIDKRGRKLIHKQYKKLGY